MLSGAGGFEQGALLRGRERNSAVVVQSSYASLFLNAAGKCPPQEDHISRTYCPHGR